MKTSTALFCLLLLPSTAPPQTASQSLVGAERAFARLCAEKGIKESFLANLADDGLLFRPGPVPGRAWTRERPAPQGLLTWEPVRWEVSAAGDLGYTTGPWQFRAKGPDDPEVSHGHYITVWKTQVDGSWKVAIDVGIGHPAGPSPLTAVKEEEGRAKAVADPEKERAALLEQDRALDEATRARGPVAALASFLSDDPVLFRMEQLPQVGREAIRATLEKGSEPSIWKPTRAEMARSGDLGFTIGTAEGRDGRGFNYLRIWSRRQGRPWKIVIDVTNPVPPPPGPND